MFFVALSVAFLVTHPQIYSLGPGAKFANQQNQSAKTALYLLGFFVLVPGAFLIGPRIADRIAAGRSRDALTPLSLALAAGIGLLVILVRLSARLPWGDGIGVLLGLSAPTLVLYAAVLRRAASSRPWPALARLAGRERPCAWGAAASGFGAVLCVTHVGSLSIVALVLGAVVLAGGFALRGRIRTVPWTRAITAFDVVAVLLLALAAVNVVVYQSSAVVPNTYFPPGVYQFQQDWIIGPANQLTAGGAVLVNDPVSQYGVGLLYFLAAWFHIAPIGYGTFSLLDGILTALVYVAGYGVLRLAGTRPWLAVCAMTVAVLTFLYNLVYSVGALPEQGPLRFGLPMALILARVLALRVPRARAAARAGALVVLAVAAVWALEAFAYTVLTYLALIAVEASLRADGERREHLLRDLGLGACAIVAGQVVFALATLIGSGHLPAWGQYLAYLHELLLGGKEGSITYGFENFSPGVAMGILTGVSAIGVAVLVRRLPEFAREHRVTVVALAAVTAYEVAVLSYTDNRASTYLLPYVALPLLLAVTLWLTLALASRRMAENVRSGIVGAAWAVAVIMIATAWPLIGSRFSQSALAHAYPGGGLRGQLSRLWHSPPIDPRAPVGAAVLDRYFPARRAIVLLPATQDLGIEILMRAGKANALFIGDPVMDDFVPRNWVPRIGRQVRDLTPGTRILTQDSGLSIVTSLRGVRFDPITEENDSRLPTAVTQAPELTWALQQIMVRFVIRTIYHDRLGFRVLEIVARR